MIEIITQQLLDQLKASNIPRATPDDLTDNPEFNIDPDVIEYLSHYAKPRTDAAGTVRKGTPCIACDARWSFTWGLTHGAGQCKKCGWPGTIYHVIKDKSGTQVAHMRGFLLWAHPSEIEMNKEKE